MYETSVHANSMLQLSRLKAVALMCLPGEDIKFSTYNYRLTAMVSNPTASDTIKATWKHFIKSDDSPADEPWRTR